MDRGRRALGRWGILASVLVVACSTPAPPPPPPPPQPEVVATAEPEPEVAPEPEPTVEAPPPEAESTGKAPSGRPPLIAMNATKVTGTFGATPAAKLRVGGEPPAELVIPEWALTQGINLTFMIDPKGKKMKTGAVGNVYGLEAQIAPEPDFVTVQSDGPPFELRLPAGQSKDANLAFGEIVTDEKGDRIEWKIIAPKKIDDVTNTAVFELDKIVRANFHITTEAPTP
jgi:hypothetical protein